MMGPNHARVTFLFLFCLAAGLAVLARASYIQIIGEPKLVALEKRQFQTKVLVTPKRGLILDRNSEPLAINIEMPSLAVNPNKVQNKKTMARLLAKALDLPYTKVYEKLKAAKEFAWIKRQLSEEENEQLKKWHLVDTNGNLVEGLWLVKESRRVYPHRELACHLIGDVNLDNEGLEGVELWANEALRGKVTSVNAVRDALGRPSFIDAVAAGHTKDGDTVQLTIDSSLQYEVEQELRVAVAKHRAQSGTVIVMNATSGEILAVANEPSFDPNTKGAPASMRRNRAFTDGFEPGSVMKAILLAEALQKGEKLTDKFYGENGAFYVQGKKISEAEAHEKFEWITLKRMMQVSSNVVAAKLALKIGAESYYNFLKQMGFAGKTGSGFPGEIAGKLPNRKDWSPLTLANVGFGQGLLATPIQMLRAYAAFANGGWLVQPTLVRADRVVGIPPKRVFSSSVAEQVSEALVSVTQTGGTGTKAAVPGYIIAGKTGTAQTVDPITKRYSRSRFMASFIGYAIGVEPRTVILALIDDPKGVYYASETAAPLFAKVFQAVANRFSLPATEPIESDTVAVTKGEPKEIKDVIKSTFAAPLILAPDRIQSPVLAQGKLQVYSVSKNGTVYWKVPNLKGLSMVEALQLLKGRKIEFDVKGDGIIRTQLPEEGKPIADGEQIRLTLSEPN